MNSTSRSAWSWKSTETYKQTSKIKTLEHYTSFYNMKIRNMNSVYLLIDFFYWHVIFFVFIQDVKKSVVYILITPKSSLQSIYKWSATNPDGETEHKGVQWHDIFLQLHLYFVYKTDCFFKNNWLLFWKRFILRREGDSVTLR